MVILFLQEKMVDWVRFTTNTALPNRTKHHKPLSKENKVNRHSITGSCRKEKIEMLEKWNLPEMIPFGILYCHILQF